MNLPQRSSSLRGRRIAVAGAGLAGLAAAWALERRGARVQIFEARHRIGGRVLTIHGLPGAAHAELGGELIEEDDRGAITALARECDLTLTRVLPGGFRYYSGRPGARGTFTGGQHLFDRLRGLLRDEIDALGRAETQPSSAIARRLGGESALDWARRSRAPREAAALVESLRGFFVAEPSEFSLLMVVQQLSEDGDPASAKMFRIAGGNGRLPGALASSLSAPIHLDSRIVRIERTRVTVESRGRRALVPCDACIVAVPASVARDIEFAPALPAPQRQAIDTLPYGRATKAAVSFDRRFWRRRGHAFATRLPIGAVWEAGAKGRRGTLAFLGGGEASATLADLVARGSHRDWQRALRWLGAGEARVLDATAVTWEADPFARGAYAHQAPAFDPALTAWLSRPAGRVAFAGEHTATESQGYMEGAIVSGLRAADDIELVLTHG